MRLTNMTITLVCAECGQILQADPHKSKIDDHLLGEVADAAFAIKPCERCREKIEEPLKKMREAIASVMPEVDIRHT